ncbi:MAG: hypothetical protein ACWA40_07290 [Planktomarina sp.]
MNSDVKANPTDLHDFVVTSDGWVNGAPAKVGDVVRLTLEAAKYENVRPKAADAKPAKGSNTK